MAIAASRHYHLRSETKRRRKEAEEKETGDPAAGIYDIES